MVIATSLMSCKKEADTNPLPSLTINVSDIIYHPNGMISISWKTTDMPTGSFVIAELYIPSDNGIGNYIPLIPQSHIGPPEEDGTANDGQETFTLPAGDNPNTGKYDEYGPIFKIYMTVQYRSSSLYVDVHQYSQIINIQP